MTNPAFLGNRSKGFHTFGALYTTEHRGDVGQAGVRYTHSVVYFVTDFV